MIRLKSVATEDNSAVCHLGEQEIEFYGGCYENS